MAHIHEKIDFTASVFIVYDNKVLLHMHKKLGIWLQPGGHIELDEDPNQAVLREAKEEAGLDIELVGAVPERLDTKYGSRELIPPRFLNRHFFDESRTHEHIDLVYFARSKSGDARPEDGAGEVRWFTTDELERNELGILPDVCRYALLALKELSS
jgi:8-oxo-dGTP pyrophosphatase MutT (NUDIX family)